MAAHADPHTYRLHRLGIRWAEHRVGRMKRELFLRSARLMRRLGVRSGLRASYLLLRNELARGAHGPPKPMRVPHVPRPIWLRDGTSDFEVMEQIFVHRAYDFGAWPSHCAMIERTYRELLERGKVPVIVDCGANIGCATIWFALRFPRAIVYAVEPEPQTFMTLGRNVSAYVNVTPIEAGISDRITRLSLRNPDGEPWACQTVDDEQGLIGTVTVPYLLDRLPNCAPLIVKVDIEGYETSLFGSNTAWAAQTPLVIFELHDWLFHWRGTGDSVFRCLTQRPRDYLVRRENIFSFAHPESFVDA
jgi:FkbM family methyltransferase